MPAVVSEFELGDLVIERAAPLRRGIITETLAMNEFTSMHGRVKVRMVHGGSYWTSPEHLRRESYMGWEL